MISITSYLINRKSSKKYKIKESLLFFSKYQIYGISRVENIDIFTRAMHSWKFWCFQHTWWNDYRIHLKKSKYPLFIGQGNAQQKINVH